MCTTCVCVCLCVCVCVCVCNTAASRETQNGDLKLAGHGASRFSGRLEIYYNGEWGTICAANAKISDFDYRAGSVACRQMGLGNVVDVYTVHNLPELRYIRTCACTCVRAVGCIIASVMYLCIVLSLSLSLSLSSPHTFFR